MTASEAVARGALLALTLIIVFAGIAEVLEGTHDLGRGLDSWPKIIIGACAAWVAGIIAVAVAVHTFGG